MKLWKYLNKKQLGEVADRMNSVMLGIANENLGKTVLVCSHGVAIEAFLRTITEIPFNEQIQGYSQKNTSVNILEYDNEKNEFSILRLNDYSHLNYRLNEDR